MGKKYLHKYTFQGPRVLKMPTGPKLPNPMRDMVKRSDPFYHMTWEAFDERNKRMMAAAAHMAIVQQHQMEQNRLRALGYRDKPISCARCGDLFIFTVKDQAFFQMKGFSEPKYCSSTCRDAARQERERLREVQHQQDLAMAITIVCIDCGNSFIFSKGEQDFYKSKGFKNPTRCPDCRAKRKNK
jgi:hypothetical protein